MDSTGESNTRQGCWKSYLYQQLGRSSGSYSWNELPDGKCSLRLSLKQSKVRLNLETGSLGVILLIRGIIILGYALTDQCHGTALRCALLRTRN